MVPEKNPLCSKLEPERDSSAVDAASVPPCSSSVSTKTMEFGSFISAEFDSLTSHLSLYNSSCPNANPNSNPNPKSAIIKWFSSLSVTQRQAHFRVIDLKSSFIDGRFLGSCSRHLKVSSAASAAPFDEWWSRRQRRSFGKEEVGQRVERAGGGCCGRGEKVSGAGKGLLWWILWWWWLWWVLWWWEDMKTVAATIFRKEVGAAGEIGCFMLKKKGEQAGSEKKMVTFVEDNGGAAAGGQTEKKDSEARRFFFF